MIKEITLQELYPATFIRGKVEEIKCTAPTRLPFEIPEQLAREIIREVPGIVSVTCNIATNPLLTIEAI
jgi:GMP synthase PP-ATPase subunit